jgi:hypothetical protein
MDFMPPLDDEEIKMKIEAVTGKEVKVLECEKKVTGEREEKLLINGFPVALQGDEGSHVKEALMAGLVPPIELLNNILMRAGVCKNPVELETVLSVKSTTRTKELVTIRDSNGTLLDERGKEVEEDDEIQSTHTEVWKRDDKEKQWGGKQEAKED